MIEVEKRALISDQIYNELCSNLNEKALKIDEVNRFTIVKVENANFKADPDNLTDIKIRTTKNHSLFTIKHGNWHNSSGRKENEIHFNKEEIGELIEMLRSLGFNYFVAMYVTRLKYKLDKLVITIDKYHHMKDILVEVEMIVKKEEEVAGAELEITQFMKKYDLNILDSKGTIDFIGKLNQIEETRIDFSKTAVLDWVAKWKDFINCDI